MNVEINNTGGTVIISDGKPDKPQQWVKKWHAFGLTFAVSNGRLKKRPYRDTRFLKGNVQRDMCEIKARIYKRNKGCCPHCRWKSRVWNCTTFCHGDDSPNIA